MDEYNVPNDPGEIHRRLKALETKLAAQSSRRSLTSSSIGGGGLRVFAGGSVTIDGTGSLYIEEGDLVLGEGSIDGAALEDQVSVTQQNVGVKSFTSSTDWAAAASLSITLPTWATTAVVSVQSNVQLPYYGLIRGYISSTGTTATNLVLPDYALDMSVCSGSIGWGGVLTGNGSVRVEARRTGAGITSAAKVELETTTIFFR